MTALTPRSAALAAAFVVNLSLAGFIGWRYRRHRLHRLFSFSVAGWAGYSLFIAGLAGLATQEEATAWIRSTAILPHLCSLTFFRFSAVLARAEGARTKAVFALGIAAALADTVGRLSGAFPVNLVRQGEIGWLPGPDPFYAFVYMPAVLLQVGGGLYLLLRRWRRAPSSLERTQLAYVFLAMGAGLVLALTFLSPGISLAGAFAPVAYTSVLAYAITRRRLLDIRLLLRRGVVLAGLGIAFGAIALSAVLISTAAWRSPRSAGIFAAVFSALVFVMAYDALRRAVSRWVDRLLGSTDWEASARLLEFSVAASVHSKVEPLLEGAARLMVERFSLERCAFLVADRAGQLLPGPIHPPAPHREGLAPASPVAQRLLREPEGLEAESLAWTGDYEGGSDGDGAQDQEDALARAFLANSRCQAAFGIQADGKLLAVMLVGAPRSGRALTEKELHFFNALASQLAVSVENARLQAQMRQNDRLSAMGTLAASLTHELRNPLATISSFLELLAAKKDPAFKDRFITVVGNEVGRLTKLTGQLLNLAKPSRPEAGRVKLCALTEQVRALVAYQFARKGVMLKLEHVAEAEVSADEAELSQVLLNLLLNALDASSEGSEVRIRVDRSGSKALLVVADGGQGMNEDVRRSLFEPFFTTKAEGTGLGLSVCLKIVQGYGGDIAVSSQPGQGACFTVQLPLAA